MKVRELEAALFDAFPREQAEAWDHVGLSVGDPEDEVRLVRVALDATAEEVRAAHAMGANVLVAHHPVYIEAPDAFTPLASDRPQAGAAVYEAARLGVSVLSFHTNLDRSRAAREALPARLGLTALTSLEHADDPAAPGYGALADIETCTLRDLAARAAGALDVDPRVWGAPASQVARVAFIGGSLGHFGDLALRAGADAIVCGEAGYHVCHDLAARGLGVVLLGHDVSEEPFCQVLARACEQAGLASERIAVAERTRRDERPWWTYTGGRLA